MFFSKLKTICLSAAVTAVMATSSFATVYHATNVTSGSQDHTFYFNPAIGGTNTNTHKHWQFDGVGIFTVNGTGVGATATLTGDIVQNGLPNNKFHVDLSFTNGVTGPNAHGPKCGGDCTDAANWQFFELVSGSLTGFSGVVDGLMLSLSHRTGTPLPQLGDGANDKNDEFGFSTWFSVNNQSNQYGDINLNLSPVPLPAGVVLLLTGLAGLGAARRFKKS